jgi:hypothetical protein
MQYGHARRCNWFNFCRSKGKEHQVEGIQRDSRWGGIKSEVDGREGDGEDEDEDEDGEEGTCRRGEQEKRLDTDAVDSRLFELSWAICALARFWHCVLSASDPIMQGPRDGALNLEALNFRARNPSTFTLVSRPFGLIWRSQFLYYSRTALVSDSSASRRVLLEVEAACHWLLLFGWSHCSSAARITPRSNSGTAGGRAMAGGLPNHRWRARHGSQNSKLPCWSVERHKDTTGPPHLRARA